MKRTVCILIAAVCILANAPVKGQDLSILSISPFPNANYVSPNANITVVFDLTIDAASLNSSSIIVRGSQTGVLSGVLTGGGTTAVTFNPDNNYRPGETVSVTINTLLLSQSGFNLVRGHTYSFTVAAGVAASTPTTLAERHVTFNPTAAPPDDIATIDFDGDGDLDFVFGAEAGVAEFNYLLENDGNQGFCSRIVGQFRNVLVFDIDGDGDSDTFGAPSSVAWNRNEGDGGPFTVVPISGSAYTMTGGDLDSDGDVDAVAAVLSGNSIRWFRNDGTGSFATMPSLGTFTGGSDSHFTLVDINSDGAMDILAFHENAKNLIWYRNNGFESFTEILVDNTPEEQWLSSADLDDDGDMDIISTSTTVAELSWYENDGNENFTQHMVPLTTTFRLDDVKTVDLDGDLDLDIVAGGYYFENDGAQNFSQNVISPGLQAGANIISFGVSHGDMDNDGDVDLLSIGFYGVSWHENFRALNITSTTPAHAEFSAVPNSNVVVSFDQPIDPASVSNNSIRITSKFRGVVDGTYSGGGTNTITFNPTNDFLSGEEIEVAVNGRLQSTSGHTLPTNYGYNFNVQASVVSIPSFTAAPAIAHATAPSGMDIADMDGDGDLDLLSCTATQLFWHENNGAGTFTPFSITTTASPSVIFAMDYNNDGSMDILLRGTSSTRIYLNDGSQNFTESAPIGNVNATLQQLSDVDRDGDLDVMVGSSWSESLCPGFVAANSVPSVSGGQAIRAADMDGDGDTDFIGAASTGGASFYRNDGFLNYTLITIEAVNMLNIDLADLDGDGDLDPIFVRTNSSIVWYENNLNTASQNFGPRTVIGSLSANPRSVVATDLDGDGDADVAAVSRTDDQVVWYENRLNEVSADFGTAQQLPIVADGPILIKSADLNGDGTMDLIVLSDIDFELNWFANTAMPPAIPSITSFAPPNGSVGTSVIITGSNFNPVAANNIVYFGATRASVTAATTTQLTVTVPPGATYQSITETVGGLTAYSDQPFIPTFSGGTPIDPSSFGAQVDFTTPLLPIGIVIGDLDLDGKTDIVISSKSGLPGTLSVLRNTSTIGTIDATSFAAPVDFVRNPGNRAGMAIGDLDGDGKPELVAVDLAGFVVSVYRNISTPGTIDLGSFDVPLEFGTGSVPQNVAIEDLDDDGKPDIVTANRVGNSISVLKNTSTPGNISFAPSVDFAAGTGAHDIAIRDLNKDGKPDLAVANEGIGSVSVFENTTTPGTIDATSFSAAINFGVDAAPTKIAIGDIDGDGSYDIVTANLGSSTISILQNQISAGPISPGSFAGAVNFSTVAPNNSVELGDLNGDGKIDIATAINIGPRGVNVLENTSTSGNISFNPYVSFTAGASTYEVAIGDMDGDGQPEIATVNNAGPSASILYNEVGAGASPVIVVSTQPASATECEGSTATFTTAATGTTNITYQWQYSVDGVVPFADINNVGGYSNTATAMLSVNTAGSFGAGRYRCKIDGDLASTAFTNDAGLIINTVPAAPTTTSANSCGAASLTLLAAGASNGQYRWYTTATGGIALSGEVNDSYITPVLSVNATYYVSVAIGSCESASRTSVTATINPIPSAPITPILGSSCTAASVTLTVSGGTNGQYRWYTAATGGTPMPGEVNDTYVTPVLSNTTSYFVSINNGTCESARTAVTVSINIVPKPVLVTSNCTATSATLTGPVGFTYLWSTGASTQQITVSTAGGYTLIVSTGGCSSPPSDPAIFTSAFCNQSPVIAPTSLTTVIQGTVTINLLAMLSDVDGNLDLTTLQVVTQPISGAIALIDASQNLTVDYAGISFSGTDKLTIQVCDVAGACIQQEISIEVAGDITIFNALSPNGDGKNESFIIQYIETLPDTKKNKVTIFNRWGDIVFEVADYDNQSRVFSGLNNSGDALPNGTYYYKLEFPEGGSARTGYLALRR